MTQERDRQIRNFISQLVLLEEADEHLLSPDELREIVLELGYDESDLERLEQTAQAHRIRGQNYTQVGALNRAAKEYAMALALEPQHLGTQHKYAQALFELYKSERDKDNLKLAGRLAEQCVARDPEFQPAYQLIGDIKKLSSPAPQPPADPPAPRSTERITKSPPAEPKPVAASPAEDSAAQGQGASSRSESPASSPERPRTDAVTWVTMLVTIFAVFPIVFFATCNQNSRQSSANQQYSRRTKAAFERRLKIPFELEAPEGVKVRAKIVGEPYYKKGVRAFDLINVHQHHALVGLKARVILYNEDDQEVMTLHYPAQPERDAQPAAQKGASRDEQAPLAPPTLRPADVVRVDYPFKDRGAVWSASRAEIVIDRAQTIKFEGPTHDRRLDVKIGKSNTMRGAFLEVWERQFELPGDGDFEDDTQILVEPEFSIRRFTAHQLVKPQLRFDFYDGDGVPISSTKLFPLGELEELDFKSSTRPFRARMWIKGATRSYRVVLVEDH